MYSSYQYMKIFCRFGKILCILNGDVNLSGGKLSVLMVCYMAHTIALRKMVKVFPLF